ncbi:FCD domain-containing protein [Telmatospirillum sp.]|uniref:FadR/GntR family transcriptional regulator n=1 Tax=Telmatospirillum sp. TaxID=2079197 RepID=UPI00283B0CD3|nr:FCD domain-containing protein [Telmatospirillum sp.]MDR3440461.1 FCD domain-containing protein [Telmatospirillum sp.]
MLERDRLNHSVVEAIEADILSGKLRIGDRLPAEAELGRIFHISTRSVREALQILETKGLIRRKHGERANVVRDDVGAFLGSLAVTVKQFFSTEPRYLVQLMDIRSMIEVESVGRLAQGEGQMSDEVERALAGMRAAVDADDFSSFTCHDAEFHLGLVHSIDNDILHVFYDNLFALVLEVIQVTSRVPNKPLAQAYAEHEGIYRLIKAKNSQAAKAAIGRQIESSAGYLRIAIEKSAIEDKIGGEAPQ